MSHLFQWELSTYLSVLLNSDGLLSPGVKLDDLAQILLEEKGNELLSSRTLKKLLAHIK